MTAVNTDIQFAATFKYKSLEHQMSRQCFLAGVTSRELSTLEENLLPLGEVGTHSRFLAHRY